MRWAAAAGVLWFAGGAVCAAFWIGRGKLINDWRDYCADYARQQADQAAQAWEPLHRNHSERLWDELEREVR